MRNFFIAMTRSAVSLLGAAITTTSGVLVLVLFAIELVGHRGNPYIGILAYLILPAFFVLGLLLIPIGIWRHRRRVRIAEQEGEPPQPFPVIDMNQGRTRKIVLTFVIFSAANLVLLSTVTYKGVEVMESTEFCGTTCHTVMEPEHTAYQGSPHSRVKCVECHIGPGANWFVKSKLSGAWQVVAVAFDLYPRPIPTPIHNLRPARETCEQCHWPSKFVGDRLKVITHYENDAENTELKTVLVLRVGGLQGRQAHGIHWHVDPRNRIRYRSDPTRETIYEVEMTEPDGAVKTFLSGDSVDSAPAHDADGDAWRVMDCVDCHNRPTHIYRTPEDGIDEALRSGRIDRALPYVRREGLGALEESYGSHEEAGREIAQRLDAFYAEEHPDVYTTRRSEIQEAAGVLGEIYATSVFPAMKVTWGTYPDHIGHQNSPGCFRCHNDEHATADGEVISQDCFTCHTLLAMEEEEPEILEMLQP